MIIGGVILTIALLIYYIKSQLKKRSAQYKFQFENFDFKSGHQNFNFNDFRNANNSGFKGYNSPSELQKAKEFFGFTSSPTKDEIKKRYKELARVYHPDLNGGEDAKMKDLNHYRDILIQTYS